MGWLIVLVVIILLGLLPIGIYAAYDRDGAVAFLTVGPFRLRLYPKQSSGTKQKSRSSKADASNTKGFQNRQSGSLADFRDIAQLVLNFLSDFRRKLRIKNLEFKLILAGDDPCDLSVNYGRACAALGAFKPHVERLFVIKKQNIEIECDFLSEQTFVEARIDMTITACRLLWIIINHGLPCLRKYNQIIKRVKGGATS